MSGRFGSVITAMVTPFRRDGSLSLDDAQELARWLLDHGSDGLVVAGSTGEGPTLTTGEKKELFRAVVQAADGNASVVCSTGTYDTRETIELTEAADDAGADAVLVVAPYYNKPPQRALVDHFTTVAKSTGLPVMLYNIPGRTATRIEHDTLLTLAEVDNIVAVKDSTGDLDAASRLIAEAPEGFELYSGDDWATFPLVCMGAVGIVSVAAHLVGREISEMVAAAEAGDLDRARDLHRRLSPLFRSLFVTSNPIPVKAALELCGRGAGDPRAPLVTATEAERSAVRQAMEALGLL